MLDDRLLMLEWTGGVHSGGGLAQNLRENSIRGAAQILQNCVWFPLKNYLLKALPVVRSIPEMMARKFHLYKSCKYVFLGF